jgi:lipopolysaccharide transport system permease protein
LEAITDIEARPSGAADDEPVRVVEPSSGLRFPDMREVWDQRDLIYLLVRRDISVRYRQSAIGASWAILQPLLLAVVFSVFLGLLAKVPSAKGIPYPVFAVSGLVMWLFFADAMTKASESTVTSEALITKVYFPRVIIPLAAVMPQLVDFALGFLVVVGALLVYGEDPSLRIVLMPVVVLVALTTALGLGLWLSALHVRYRDVKHVVPFAILLGLFLTPITYPFDLVPSALQPLYALNPLVGVLEGYRWVLFDGFPFPGAILLIPFFASLLLVISGALFFERMETTFADVI